MHFVHGHLHKYHNQNILHNKHNQDPSGIVADKEDLRGPFFLN